MQTNTCLQSILNNKVVYSKILVINNGSYFYTNLDRNKNKITIINNKKNLGFAGGMNTGIRYGLSKTYDYFLLLNNDTFLQNNCVLDLTNFLDKNKSVGIVGPVIEFQKNNKTVFDLGGKINLLIGRTSHNEVNKIVSFRPQIVDYISGCCMLIKRDVFENAGLFDERFFLYYEDVDLCLRAGKSGFETIVATKKSMYHALSGSVGKNSHIAVYHQTASAVLFGKKYSESVNKLFNILFILIQSFIIFIKNPIVGQYAFSGFVYGIHKRHN